MLATTKRDSDNWNSIRSYEKVWLWLAFFASKCRGKEAQEWRIKFHKRLIHNSLLRVLSRHQVVFMKMMVAFSLRQQPTFKVIYPKYTSNMVMLWHTDYRRPVRKSPSLHGRKSTPTPKFLGTAEAYFVCHIGPNFQISLIYAFIGCP